MKLPHLMSGPILRRAHSKSVVIWLATSEPTTIRATFYSVESEHQSNTTDERDTIEESFNYCSIPIHSKQHSSCLGTRLYIHLIECMPKDNSFPTDQFIGYNLHFSNQHKKWDLKDLGLLDSLSYPPFDYPTFFIKETSSSSHVIYGSCRKFHGKGEDALPASDHLLAETATEMEQRPNALFLIGDQIYADDVAAPILPFLSRLGIELAGGKQEPLAELDPRLKRAPFPEALQQVNGRQFIINELALFTSEHTYNHLITFGEFAAMYLLNWSPALWEVLEKEGGLPTFSDLKKEKLLYLQFPKDELSFRKEYQTEIKHAKKTFDSQRERVRDFQKGLTGVRRLLANISTYMIFDDHDLTDDWNISKEWKENVEGSALGSHIITNGLTAYWAFQGWGNSPEDFSKSFINKMERYLNTLNVSTIDYEEWRDTLLSFGKWAFVAPTQPKALFLDTRTMRHYDVVPEPVQLAGVTRETRMSGELLSQEGWKLTEDILFTSGWQKQTPLLIVSATPLFGMELIENFVLKYIYPFRSFGFPVEDSFDIEAWKDNGKGFTEFLKRLQDWRPHPSLILSGDVHYGFQAESNVLFTSPKREHLTIYQLTSSPMKNKSFSGFTEFLLKCAVRLTSLFKKRKEVHHYCDKTYRLIAKKQLINDPTSINWHERIYYDRDKNGQILKTTNNIGVLSLEAPKSDAATFSNTVKWSNQLLTKKRT